MAKRTTVKYRSNRPIVIKKGEDAAKKIGNKFGAYVQRVAKNSIKKRKKPKKGEVPEASKPGEPAKDVTGALKNFIRFGYDDSERRIYIGPVLLPGKTKGAIKALERGGSVKASVLEEPPTGRRIKNRKRVIKSIAIEERPTMRLALGKSIDRLPQMWKGAIRQ